MSEFLEILSPGALEELRQVQALVKSLASDIKSINNFKTSSTPSGADKNIKSISDAYGKQAQSIDKVRSALEKTYQKEIDLQSKKQSQINKSFEIAEKQAKKERDIAEKTYQKEIELNNKRIQSEQARANKEIAIAEKKAQKLAQIDAKNSRTGSSSVIPGMGTKINDLKAQEREAQKAQKALEKLGDAYRQLVTKQQQAKKTLQDLIVTQGASSAATKKAQKEYDNLTSKVNQANKATSNFSKAGLGGVVSGFRNLLGAFGIIGGIQLFAGLVKSGFELTRKLDSLNFTMKAVIENGEILKQTQLFLTDTADKYGASIVTLTERYNKFYTAARQSGVSLEDTEAIFQSFTKSAGFLGLKSHELEGVFLALEQMLSKGKVTTEELRRQLGERLPGAFGVMAQTVQKLNPDIEVTVAILDEMLRAGTILSKDVLPEFARQYEKSIGIVQKERVETLNASIERMSNSWVSFIGSVSTGDGVLSKVLRSAVDYIGLVVKGLEYLAKGDSQVQIERNYGIYVETLKSKVNGYKELGKEADAYAKIEKTRSEKELERLRKEKSHQEDIMAVQSKKLGILKYSNGAYSNAVMQSDRLSASISREEAVLKAANNQLIGYVEQTETASKKGRTYADVLKDISNSQDELKNSTKDEAKDILDRINLLNKEKEAWEESNKTKKKGVDYIKNSLSYLEAQLSLFQKQQKDLAKNSKEWAQYQEKIDLATMAIDNFNIAIQGVAKFSGLKSIKGNTPDEIFKKPEKIEGISENGNKSIEENIELLEKQRKAILELEKALKDYHDSFQEDFFSSTGFDFLGDILMDFDKFKEMLESAPDGEKWMGYFNAIAEVAQETFNFISQNSQANFDAEYARLEKHKDTAILFAGESDAAKEQIEKQYEARRKAIQTREAQAQKQMAIVNTVINTAQAIIATFSKVGFPAGVPLAAIMAAIGAAQIAVISSQKIPEFFKGTTNANEGLAWTQERGAEIHTDKKGNIKDFGDNKGARLTMMEKGDKVYTADQTKKLLFNNDLNNILTSNNILPPSIEIKSGASASEIDSIMAKHFSNIQTNNIIFDEGGVKKYFSKGNSTTILHNNRTSFKGLSV